MGSTLTFTATAVTPQEGWKITGEATHDNFDYWIISTSNNTIGYYTDLDSVFYYNSLQVGNYTYDRYTYIYNYWQGFSTVNFAVDTDWFVLATVSDKTNAGVDDSYITFGAADVTKLPRVTVNTSFAAAQGSNEITFNVPIVLGPINRNVSLNNQSWIKMSSVYNEVNITGQGVNTIYPNKVYINDLIFFASRRTTGLSVGDQKVPHMRVAIVLACPKAKLPADLQIGDEFPGSDIVVNVSTDEYQKAWSQALTNVFPQSGSSQLGVAASVTKELANEANTGAVGSFEISEQQIDTIAGWFHNSFVFQWFSMFVLMFVLLFFIKKGMA